MHQAGVGIDVEELKEPRKHGRNVGVHQFEQPEPDEQQQCSLEQLEHRDGGHPGMVPARTSHYGTYLYHSRSLDSMPISSGLSLASVHSRSAQNPLTGTLAYVRPDMCAIGHFVHTGRNARRS